MSAVVTTVLRPHREERQAHHWPRRGQAESSRQDLAHKLQQEERKSPRIMNKVSPQRSGNVNARVEYSRARRKARIDSTNGVNIDVRPSRGPTLASNVPQAKPRE